MTLCPETMIALLDIHSHRTAPYPQGIISVEPAQFSPVEGQLWSVGLHPWNLPDDPAAAVKSMNAIVTRPDVVAIGETGLDSLRGAPMWLQILSLQAHIRLSEEIGKPLVLHCVRAHDSLLAIRREMRPAQPWIIHGFRGKPTVARILLDAGCHISLGERFNPAAAAIIPSDRLLAETDESPLPIARIIAAISEARGADALPAIQANLSRLTGIFLSV